MKLVLTGVLVIGGLCCAQSTQPPATVDEMKYLRFVLLNVASLDNSPEAIQSYEDHLVKLHGLSALESSIIHAAVVDGNLWPVDGHPPASANGCTFGHGVAFNAGVEAYGTGHYFYNNEIVNNTGAGMNLAGASDTNTRDITISSWNPFDASDTPRYIEQNLHGGIAFLGPVTNPTFTRPAIGVTLDNVLVRDNATYGVVLDTVAPDYVTNWNIGGQYVGFVNYGCLINNGQGSTYTPGTTLPNSTPMPPNQYRNGAPGSGLMAACPTTPWPQLPAPAPSHIPGWSW